MPSVPRASTDRGTRGGAPSALQAALLHVALAPPDNVAGRWQALRREHPGAVDAPDELDWGSQRLLPLVAWNLRSGGVDDPAAVALRHHLRAAMVVGRARARDHAAVLRALADGGVEALVLKGVALGRLVYPDPGTRPASDLDVLVRPDDFPRCLALVAERGELVDYRRFDAVTLRRFRHSAGVVLDGRSFDLHWRLLHERFDERADDGVWERRQALRIADVDAVTPCAEDHLVHAVLHGLRWNALAPVRWIADGALLVRSAPLRWELVEQEGARRRIGAVLADGLELLRTFDVDVPSSVITSLRSSESRLWAAADRWTRRPHDGRSAKFFSSQVVGYGLASRGLRPGAALGRYGRFLYFANASRADNPTGCAVPDADWLC